MVAGIPYLTLDPATGQPVARYADGTVQPLPKLGGLGDASLSPAGTARPGGTGFTAPQRSTGTTRLPGGNGPGGGFDPTRFTSDAIPPPSSGGYGGSSGGGGGGYVDVRARLAAARARISGALGGSSYGGSSSSTSSIPQPERPDRLHGRYAHGLDPVQAQGLALHPTAMLPRVFPHLTPADPLYARLAALPVGQWATILSNGSPQGIANRTGRIYQGAATTGALPSTNHLLAALQRGKGLEASFQGVKAGPHDYQSYTQPGYVSGQEPMPLGEATYQYGGLLDAALAQEPLLTAAKYGSAPGGWGAWLVDKWAGKAMKRPPGKGKPIYRSVGRKLFR